MADHLMVGEIKHERLTDGSWRLTHPSGVVVIISVAKQLDYARRDAKNKIEAERGSVHFKEQTDSMAALSAQDPGLPQER